MIDNATGYFLETDGMRWFFDHYARTDADFDDWRMSPLRAPDLSGLAPATVLTAEFDPLRDQGEAYGQRLRDAGVPTEIVRADGLFHGYFGMQKFLPPAEEPWDTAVRCAARRVREGVTCRCIRRPRRSAISRTRRRVEMAPEDRVEMTRTGWGLYLAMTGGPQEPIFAVEDRDADGVPVRVYRPSPDEGLPILVVLHGGGWVIGTVEQYDGIARQLANASGAIVVSVDYRLAPEHPFPAPLDDCWHALQWTAAHAAELGGDASRDRDRRRQRGRQPGRGVRDPRTRLRRSRPRACKCSCTRCATATSRPARTSPTAPAACSKPKQMQWFFDCYTAGRRRSGRLADLAAARARPPGSGAGGASSRRSSTRSATRVRRTPIDCTRPGSRSSAAATRA